MFKNVLLSFITAAVLVFSGGVAYQAFSNTTAKKSLSQAKRECSQKIPDSEGSVERSGGAINATYTSYVHYPSFDRCMASKGQ